MTRGQVSPRLIRPEYREARIEEVLAGADVTAFYPGPQVASYVAWVEGLPCHARSSCSSPQPDRPTRFRTRRKRSPTSRATVAMSRALARKRGRRSDRKSTRL